MDKIFSQQDRKSTEGKTLHRGWFFIQVGVDVPLSLENMS
jgi:hypothetical protein